MKRRCASMLTLTALASAMAACGPRITSLQDRPVADVSRFSECGSNDAIGYRCADGRVFSARHNMDSTCLVVLAGSTYVVRRTTPNAPELTGAGVTLRLERNGSRATLTGAPEGDYVDCTLAE